MKHLVLWVAVLLATVNIASASPWGGFKGIYLGMSIEKLRQRGVSHCARTQSHYLDETCTPDGSNNSIETFGGEPVNYLQAGVKNGKVVNLNIKTSGLPGGGLEKMMQQKYGKPAYATGDWTVGAWRWEKGNEYISLHMENGANDVFFTINDSADVEKKYKNKRKAAAKDF